MSTKNNKECYCWQIVISITFCLAIHSYHFSLELKGKYPTQMFGLWPLVDLAKSLWFMLTRSMIIDFHLQPWKWKLLNLLLIVIVDIIRKKCHSTTTMIYHSKTSQQPLMMWKKNKKKFITSNPSILMHNPSRKINKLNPNLNSSSRTKIANNPLVASNSSNFWRFWEEEPSVRWCFARISKIRDTMQWNQWGNKI